MVLRSDSVSLTSNSRTFGLRPRRAHAAWPVTGYTGQGIARAFEVCHALRVSRHPSRVTSRGTSAVEAPARTVLPRQARPDGRGSGSDTSIDFRPVEGDTTDGI
jgi:hypothetical protein